MDKSDFAALCKVWNHCALSRQRKLEIFDACIMSKLMYCLMTMVHTKAESRRLDGFQCRCLRKIVGIAPSYWSRISNATVMQVAARQPLSELLAKERTTYLGQVAQRDGTDFVRCSIFEADTNKIKVTAAKRRRGRPRKCWMTEVMRDWTGHAIQY